MNTGRFWPIYRWILAIVLIINSVIVLLTANTLLDSGTHSIVSFMGALGIVLGLLFSFYFVREYISVHRRR